MDFVEDDHLAGEGEASHEEVLGAVDQTPSQTFAFAFLIDGDAYLLQNRKVAIEGSLGAAEFGRGVGDGQSITLVKQTKQPLLPSQGPTAHRASVYARCVATVKRARLRGAGRGLAPAIPGNHNGCYGWCNMTENVSTAHIRQRIGELLDRVALRRDEFIIERKGKPMAVLFSVERLE